MASAKANSSPQDAAPTPVRIDRWLWAARFYKTRSLAKAAVEGGKVHVDGQRAKPAKAVKIGQTISLSRGTSEMIVVIESLSDRRGSATEAQKLYAETSASIEQRELLSSRRRMERAGLQVPNTKPSKKDRRDLRKLKNMDAGWDSQGDDQQVKSP